MSDNCDDNHSSQKEELLVLKSMYDESVLCINEDQNIPNGIIYASVRLPSTFIVQNSPDLGEKANLTIDHLPPITLTFEFPTSYPSSSPPVFSLSCTWLSDPQLGKLRQKLENMWTDSRGEVILFNWVIFLQEDCLSFLGVNDILDVTKLCQSTPFKDITSNATSSHSENHEDSVSSSSKEPQNHDLIKTSESSTYTSSKSPSGISVIDIIKEYDNFKKLEAFNASWLTCEICYLDKQGHNFAIVPKCRHHFCKDCLKAYYEIQIKEGNINSLKCPADDCSSEVDATFVKQLIEVHLFEKYDSLLLMRTLENMPDVAYCPRNACQTPSLLDIESRLGRCQVCKFTFCIFCRMTYHGISPCNLRNSEMAETCTKYLEGSQEEKLHLESRYGKRFLKVYVDNYLSEKWVFDNSKECPHCRVKIEKFDGCNKITCYPCGRYFCWLCMSQLKQNNPYSHYGDRTSPCYNQLFPDGYEENYPGEFL